MWVYCSLAEIAAHIKRLIYSRILNILKTIVIRGRFGPAEGAWNIATVELGYWLVTVG